MISLGRNVMPLLMELYGLAVLTLIVDAAALVAVVWRLCAIIKDFAEIIAANDIQKPRK